MQLAKKQPARFLVSPASLSKSKQMFALLMVLVLVFTLACSQEEGTCSREERKSQVFRSEGGHVTVTVKPFSGLVQGDTITFEVEVEGKHQVYLTRIVLEPEKSLWYRWAPVLLYREHIKWPEIIPVQEGGLDAAKVKTQIPADLEGSLEVTLQVTWAFPRYMESIGKYEPDGAHVAISIPLNLPSKPEAQKSPLSPGLGVPFDLGQGAALAVDEVKVIGDKALLRLSLDNTESKTWLKPGDLRFWLVDKAGVEAPWVSLLSAREVYPSFEGAKGEISQGWLAYDIGDVGQELFLYFWDQSTMNTMAFIYVGEVKRAEPSQLFRVESWNLVKDNGMPAFEIRSVQAHDCKVSLFNPEGRRVETVELPSGEEAWKVPLEARGTRERDASSMVAGAYTLVANESHIGEELNTEAREFGGARLEMEDASLSLQCDEPYSLFEFKIFEDFTAQLSNTGDLPIYIGRVQALLDDELSIMNFRPEVYIYPGEEFALQEMGSPPRELKEYLTPGNKQVTVTVVPANCESVSQVLQYQGPVLSIEHAEVTWFYSQADKAYMTTGLDISIHSSGDMPGYLKTMRVSAGDRVIEPDPRIYIMPGENWHFHGSLFLSGVTPGDKELKIEILAADGSIMDSYSESIHLP